MPEPTFPLWTPRPAARASARMGRFFAQVAAAEPSAPPADAPYDAWHRWTCDQPDRFWSAVWREAGLVADGALEPVLVGGERMRPPAADGPRWFPGTRLNFAENLLHAEGEGPAVIACDEAGRRRELTVAELRDWSGRVAAALAHDGVSQGGAVAGFMPNVPEAVMGMLGAATLGAVWTSCSPDFGVRGVLDRFGQVGPRVLICADGYRYAGRDIDCLPRVREIVDAIPAIARVVVVPFLRQTLSAADLAGIRGAVAWADWAVPAAAPAFARLPFDHPLYVMYSSGTTGLPKCMVHGAGGTLLQHVKEHQLHCDIGPGDRVFYFTTCGWMMWNWLVSALASGATLVLYDGAPIPPSDPDLLWRMAAEERITVFGTSAKFVAACEKAGLRPAAAHDLSALRMILSTGSPLADHSFDYVLRDIRPGVHLASISGGTDLISCFMLGNPLLPVWRGELQCAGLGMAVDVWDADGHPVCGVPGELVCTRPFPSMPVAFWNDPDGAKYRDAYFTFFPGAWRHGDWVERTAHDGFVVHGRSDATLNPGGVRIGTAEIYRQVEQVSGVVESVVVGQDVPDGQGGADMRIVLFVRLADGVTLDDGLRDRIRARLRQEASPHHVPRVILQVHDIPRTISGKITELAIRDVIHGREVKNTDALANPGALAEYRHRPELAV
jgi:acetoacetyl-CoA synthetase